MNESLGRRRRNPLRSVNQSRPISFDAQRRDAVRLAGQIADQAHRPGLKERRKLVSDPMRLEQAHQCHVCPEVARCFGGFVLQDAGRVARRLVEQREVEQGGDAASGGFLRAVLKALSGTANVCLHSGAREGS